MPPGGLIARVSIAIIVSLQSYAFKVTRGYYRNIRRDSTIEVFDEKLRPVVIKLTVGAKIPQRPLVE